ncbi:MAG: SprB repeat-containing protein [Bacteroidia bacterium]|nr:SprB repeat-containing protein [Bacteroidia bacterium]
MKKSIFGSALVLFCCYSKAQNAFASSDKQFPKPETYKNANRQNAFTISNPGQTNVFVKNHGQFDNQLRSTKLSAGHKIIYAINSSDQIFFTPNGYIWKQTIFHGGRTNENETKHSISESEHEEEERNAKAETYCIRMNWEGADPNAQIIAEEEAEGYYTYGVEGFTNLKAKGYRKLIYKNMYPGIDIEYIIPDSSATPGMNGGIKYTLNVRPGADVKKVKMHYEGNLKKIKLDSAGNVIIVTPAGNLIDHAPQSFYQNKNETVSSSFELNKNTVSFKLVHPQSLPSEQQETLIIDPWTVFPNTWGNKWSCYDVDYDKYGNVYIDFLVGNGPAIAKYSPTGTFLWSNNVTLALASNNPCYTDFCVIPSGSVFIASSFGNNLCKISSAGVLLTTVTWPVNLNNEGWVVAYNKCLNILLIGGGGTLNATCIRMGVDTALVGTFTGNNFSGGTQAMNDIARMLIDDNGDLYTFFTSFAFTGTGNKIFKSVPPYNSFLYSTLRTASGFTEQSGPGSRSGRLNVMAINSNYLYFFDGKNLEARNKANGALIASIVVSPAYIGGHNLSVGYKNEGIAVDECNNVYVGGQSLVHVFNFNGSTFTTLPAMAVSGNVSDIMLDKSKQLIYVTGFGFLSSLSALPCNSNLLSINIISAVSCAGNGTATVTVSGGTAPYSYTWSNGSTNTTINVSPGTYTVTVSDGSCGNFQSSTATVTIGNSGGLVINSVTQTTGLCAGGAASATAFVSGGNPDYTYFWNPSAQTTQTAIGLTQGNYTVSVTDKNGCTTTGTVAIISPPALLAQYTKGTANCSNCGCKEWIMVTGINGTPPYNYQWSDGYDKRYKNALCPGAYNVIVTDNNGCKTTVKVNAP